MKRIYIIILAFIAMLVISCEPEQYTGPLDSPVGNWEGISSEYYFNGEKVAALDSCETTVISFYKQGLCCMEGVKGAFPFIYDNAESLLQIDSTLWAVDKLTGAEMVLSYLYRILPAAKSASDGITDTEQPEEPADPEQPADPSVDPENPETPEEPEIPEQPEEPVVKPDANGFILPIEYKGMSINADRHGYYYINDVETTVYCNFKGWKNEDKTWTVDFWYDTHTDYFIPLVVEVTKK